MFEDGLIRILFAGGCNCQLRMECLNRELIYMLSETRVVFEDWREYCSRIRPHRSLGLKASSEYARELSESYLTRFCKYGCIALGGGIAAVGYLWHGIFTVLNLT
ncbi:MAG: integrase core domain-containing protein [Chthoniobacterales bacterium]